MIAVFIPGDPRPQGSKRHVGNGVMVEMSKHVKDWRGDVRSALTREDGQPRAVFTGPIRVRMVFVLRRPKGAPKSRVLTGNKKPDLDKLQRAIFDAVTSAGIWADDSQVVACDAYKDVAGVDETPGLHLTITEWAGPIYRTDHQLLNG